MKNTINTTEKETLKVTEITISVIGANGEMTDYWKNGSYIQFSEREIAEIFNLEKVNMINELASFDVNNVTAFNTYNWNAPFTFDGVYFNDCYSGGMVNIHLGGDVRGNYSDIYFCEEIDALLSQNTFMNIQLSNGESYRFDCENGEGYFSFDTFDHDVYDVESIEITPEVLEELEEKQSI